METERFKAAVYMLNRACNTANKSEEDLEYIVLQGLPKDDPYLNDPFILYEIAYFYNHNWLGNVDFMHIPNFKQVEENCNNYPVIIAREKETKNMIGISTLKYEENSEGIEDPYFPIPNEKYFSITGILTKMGNPHRGVGKKIYEIALKGYYDFNKVYGDTSIMCVIDCRNKNSLNALHSAAETLNEEVDENMVAKVSGYYTVTDKNKEMVEAPTLVLKVEEDNKKDLERRTIEYVHPAGEKLFDALHRTLREEITDVSGPIVSMDYDAGLVSYYLVHNYYSLPKVISNGTEEGNDRIPYEDSGVQVLKRVRSFR